ncbi:hypothetical protein H1R20_g12487, partial [Candolleomyces eurysporus]
MIIFRVTTGRSFTNLPLTKDAVLTNPIQFAHRTAESSFLQSALNREFGQNGGADTEQGLDSCVGELASQTRTSIIHVAREKWNDGGDVERAG